MNEQAKAFGMAERGGTILRFQLSEGLGHTVELQGFELIQCWVGEHILSSSMKVSGASRQRRATFNDRHTFGVTDVGVSDRRAVYYPAVHAFACMRGRGGRAALAIKTIFQNGIQGCV